MPTDPEDRLMRWRPLQRRLEVERPTIVHIGRIAHEKNIGFLIDVMHLARR